MARCIILIRISTKQQDYSAQKKELIDYAISNGYKKQSQRILIENIESAIKLDEEHRQGIADMKRYIEEDSSINCVFCWEISRLGRRYDVIESVRDFLIEHKVNLKLYHEGVQLLDKDGSVNTGGKLVVDVSMAIAKYEMETKIARLNREKERKTNEGKAPTGKILYGYRFDKDGYVEVDEDKNAPRVREIFEWAKDGKSTLWIWDECYKRGYFTYRSRNRGKNYICSILSQPAYCGREGYRTKTKYKAIITEKLFDEVAKAKKERMYEAKTTSKFVAYGKSLVKYLTHDGKECAMCIGHSRNSYRTNPGVLPTSVNINMNVIDYVIWKETVMLYTRYLVKQGQRNFKKLQDELNVAKLKVEASKKIIKSLKNQKERKGDRYDLGELTLEKYKEDIKVINKQIKKEEGNITNYEESLTRIKKQIDGIGEDRWARIDYKSIESITDDIERKKIIDTIILGVLVTSNGVTERGDKKYKIEIKQKVNFLYNTYFEYWQRGGVFHLIKCNVSPVGEQIVTSKDISNEIVRRFPSDWSIRHHKE